MWGEEAIDASSDIPVDKNGDDKLYVDSFFGKLYGTPSKTSRDKSDTTEKEIVLLSRIFAEFLKKFIYKCARRSIENEEEAISVVPEIHSDILSNFHYILVMPTHWDFNIRDTLREIFVQAVLIEKHQDMYRLQFCTELDSTLNYIQQPRHPRFQKLNQELTKRRQYLMVDFYNSSCSFIIFGVKPMKVLYLEPFVEIISTNNIKDNIKCLLKDKVMGGSELNDKILLKVLDYFVKKIKVINNKLNSIPRNILRVSTDSK